MDLQSYLRTVADYPKPGILFYDITPLLLEPQAFHYITRQFVQRYENQGVTKIIALDARGFIFGAPLALGLNAGFVPVRKPQKLPAATWRESYELEYGTAALELHCDALQPHDRVVIIDDLLATGGTASAATRLVARAQAQIVEIACVIELVGLKGRERLAPHSVFSLLPLAA